MNSGLLPGRPPLALLGAGGRRLWMLDGLKCRDLLRRAVLPYLEGICTETAGRLLVPMADDDVEDDCLGRDGELRGVGRRLRVGPLVTLQQERSREEDTAERERGDGRRPTQPTTAEGREPTADSR